MCATITVCLFRKATLRRYKYFLKYSSLRVQIERVWRMNIQANHEDMWLQQLYCWLQLQHIYAAIEDAMTSNARVSDIWDSLERSTCSSVPYGARAASIRLELRWQSCSLTSRGNSRHPTWASKSSHPPRSPHKFVIAAAISGGGRKFQSWGMLSVGWDKHRDALREIGIHNVSIQFSASIHILLFCTLSEHICLRAWLYLHVQYIQ